MSHVPVIMRLVVLLFFAEIFGKVAENGSSIRRTAFKCRDAAGPAPTIAPLYTDNDVFIEESALLEETYGGFGSEFIRAEFADADQIAQPLGLLGLSHFEERI